MIEEIINGIKYLLDEENLTAEVIKKSDGYKGDIIIPTTVMLNEVIYRVITIGENAFEGCSSLKTITIGNGVKIIGDSAFSKCKKLIAATIPDSVESIGNCAFKDCTSLPAITIHDSLKIMGESAFDSCSSLETITYIGIPEKWNNWHRGNGWNNNTPAKIVCEPMAELINGIYYRLNENKLTAKVIMNGSSESDIDIPEIVKFNGVSYRVTSIGGCAFYCCDSQSKITIHNGVENIESSAFHVCSSLNSIVIPDSVTSIGLLAFCYCISLTSITFQGTKAQWEEIALDEDWNSNVSTKVVHCTDGDVEV